MADYGKTLLFVFLIVFWTVLSIISATMDINVTDSRISEILPENKNPDQELGTKNFITGLFDKLEDIPVLNNFLPLFKIMSFQYSDDIPIGLSIFLSMTFIFSGYIVYSMITGR